MVCALVCLRHIVNSLTLHVLSYSIRVLTCSLHSVKQMMGPAPHTQLDAELAAGMGRPDNGPKLMSM